MAELLEPKQPRLATEVPGIIPMPTKQLPPSASGMRWFHTPEEYLSEWKPRLEWMAYTPETSALGKKCPSCGGTTKIFYLTYRHNYFGAHPRKRFVEPKAWHHKRFFCGHTWPVKLFPVFVEMSPEEWVFARIRQTIAHPPSGFQRMLAIAGIPTTRTVPLGVAFGSVEAMSRDSQAHRDGVVIAAMSAYQHYLQQQQEQQQLNYADSLHATEGQTALALAQDYFGVAQRAAQEARNERYAEMQEMARLMAKEMFAEAARNRSTPDSTNDGTARHS